MFKKPINVKVIAWFVLIPSLLVFFGGLFLTYFLASFGFASGVSFLQLTPFLILMFLSSLLAAFGMYVSVRYFKNQPFKENKNLGLLFIIFGLGYFVYQVLICILSNLTGNEGGYLKSIVALLLLFVLIPLGLGLKNGYK